MHSQQYRSRRASHHHSNTSAVSQANGWGRDEGRECSWSSDFANLHFLSSVVWCLLRLHLHSVYTLATLLDLRYKRRLFAPDKLELEAIKQWAIDEAWFEPSSLPANTPQPPPAKKKCRFRFLRFLAKNRDFRFWIRESSITIVQTVLCLIAKAILPILAICVFF